MKFTSLGGAAAAALLLLTLTSCSSAGKKTCQEYAASSIADRTSMERDLLSEHDLDTGSLTNLTGVSESLQTFCGVSAFGGPAGKNAAASLDNAVVWDSPYW